MADPAHEFDVSAKVWQVATGPMQGHVPIKLQWNKAIPYGRGSKYQRERLVLSMKGLLAALIEHGGIRGPYAASSVKNLFRDLVRIVAWMTEREIWAFRDLKPSDVVDFFVLRTAERGKPFCEATLRIQLRMFRQMWIFRASYAMPLRFDPLVVESEIELSVRTRDLVPFRSLGEESALPLLRDALAWVRDNGPVVVDMVRRMWAERRTHVGLTTQQANVRAHRFRMDLVSDPEIQRIARQLRMERASAASVVDQIVETTEGACTVALLFLVGLRTSECVGLDADCIEPQGEEGLDRRFVLKGFAAKKRGMRRTWAASDDVVEVAKLLVDLYAEVRGHTGQTALMLVTGSTVRLHVPGRMAMRIHANSLSRRMNDFASSPHRDGGTGIHLHPHMARKTFARFVVMRDKSALESLAYHFGHVHSSLTDGTYVGSDIALAKLLREEDRDDLADALMDLLSGGPLGGGAAGNLVETTERVTSGDFRGKRSLRSAVEKLIDDGILLAPCDWGYCVYSKATSACGGDDRGPNAVRRAPDVCATCSNFSVSERHRPYWNERLRRDEEFLKRSDLPEQTRQVVDSRAEHSRGVLVSLVPRIGAGIRVRTE